MSISISAHHMSFPVADLERSRQFYEGVLGLESIPRPDFGDVQGIWYQAGPCEVHLILRSGHSPAAGSVATIDPGERHAAFAVDSFDSTVAHFAQHDIEVLASRNSGQMWCLDPDGHVLEFIEPGILTA